MSCATQNRNDKIKNDKLQEEGLNSNGLIPGQKTKPNRAKKIDI